MNRIRGIAVIACAVTLGMSGTSRAAESLVVDADAEITVEAGVTNRYVFLAGSKSATLTKKGAGVLEFLGVQNKDAKIVVEEGEVAFRKPPRPDEVFANAYLHLDASDASTLVTETVNGTNFVVRWNDADGRSICATNSPETRTWRPDPENRRAFLSYDKTDVGLPVVDLGEPMFLNVTNADGVAYGYGAALQFAPRKTLVCEEFFTVTEDNESVKTAPAAQAGPGFLGNSYGEMHARRGNTASGKNPPLFTWYSSNEGSKMCYFGTNALDGVTVASDLNFPDGFHVLSCQPTATLYANSLGRNYRSDGAVCDTFGGIRHAEVLILSNRLDGVSRTNVNAYLMAKWERQTLASLRVCSGAKVTVEDGLHYAFGEYVQDDGTEVSVTAGQNVAFDTIGDLDIYGRFDASDLSSLETNLVNGTNFVTRWNSQDDETLFATNYWGTADSALTSFRPDPQNRLPYLAANASATGLPAVDFGSFLSRSTSSSGGDKDGTEGYGAAFCWSKTGGAPICEFFTVAADDETRLPWPTHSSTRGIASYLGTISNTGYGLRGSSGKLFDYWSSLANTSVTSKDAKWISLDGVAVSYDTARPAAGFHVINNVPSKAISCDAFAHQHRKGTGYSVDTYGGLKIGEFIGLKTAIESEAHRARVNQHLMHKWLGTPKGVRTYDVLELQKGASFAVVYEDVIVANLTLGGSIGAEKITASNLNVTAADTAIAGAFVLGESPAFSFAQIGETAAVTSLDVGTLDLGAAPGTITVSVAKAKALRGKTVKLIGFESVAGTLDGWTVESNYDAGVSVTLETDGIYATFGKPGMMLLIR